MSQATPVPPRGPTERYDLRKLTDPEHQIPALEQRECAGCGEDFEPLDPAMSCCSMRCEVAPKLDARALARKKIFGAGRRGAPPRGGRR